jgi:hypothetical protein
MSIKNIIEARDYVIEILKANGYKDVKYAMLNMNRHFAIAGTLNDEYHKYAGTWEKDYFRTGWWQHRERVPSELMEQWKGPWVSCRWDMLILYASERWDVRHFLLVYSDGKVYAINPRYWLDIGRKYKLTHVQETGELLVDIPLKLFERWQLELEYKQPKLKLEGMSDAQTTN